MKYRSEITSETDDTVIGKTYVQMTDDGPWEFSTDYHRSKTDMWFIGKPQEVLARLGITTTEARAEEFCDLIDGNINGFYYVSVASDGTDEAIKWIMGSLAAELNEKGLPFSKAAQVLPADYLRTFVSYLNTGKFERNFAKEIFAALLVAPRHGSVPGEKVPDWENAFEWEEFTARIEAGEEFPHGAPYRIETEMVPFDTETVLDQIIADPRFKAVDTSEIDSIIDGIIAANPEQAAKVAEKPAMLQWFLGQVLKASKGRAPPQVVKSKLEQRFNIVA